MPASARSASCLTLPPAGAHPPARTMERPPATKGVAPCQRVYITVCLQFTQHFKMEIGASTKRVTLCVKRGQFFLRKISRRVAPRKVFLIETILLTYSLAQIGVEIMLVFQRPLAKRVCTLTAIKGLFFALSLQSQIFTFTREGVCERRTQGNNSPEHRASI